VQRGRLLRRYSVGFSDRDNQQRIHAGAGAKAVVPPGEIAERMRAEFREAIADFFGQRAEIGDDHLRFAIEASTEFFVLRGDADGAGVEMALAGHNAADGEERGGAEAEFVGAEECAYDDVARKFQAAVDAERDAGAKAGADKSVMCFTKADFPRQAGVFD